MEKSNALGVDVLEMDLRATSDGVLVLMHDRTVDRTTNGSGRVDAMTFEEIRKLDAGFRFENPPGIFPYRGKGVTVTRFEEVLSRLDRARLNIEMKGFTPELAAKFCRMLTGQGAANRALVAAVDQESISAFRKACPSVATSTTMREGLMLYEFNRAHLVSLYRSPAVALQIPEVFREQQVVEPRFLDLARKMNIKVQVWTVNGEADMKRLLDLGVHGILTDYPDRLLRVMGRAPSAQ